MLFLVFEDPANGGFMVKFAGEKFRKQFFFEGIDKILHEYIKCSETSEEERVNDFRVQ